MTASRRTWVTAVPLAAMLLTLTLVVHAARGQGNSWPRQFDSTSGSFIVYEPQPEQMKGDMVVARAAFSLQKPGASAPTFGVLWYQAHVQTDRDNSTATQTDLDVTKVRLPGATVAEAKRYEHLVEAEATGWDLSGSLDELQAGLAASAKERRSIENLDHTPPQILFTQQRTILVAYDGSPEVEDIEGSRLQRVVNTPYAVVYDVAERTYWLNGANLWYRASDPLGPWTVAPAPAKEIVDVVPADTTSADQLFGTPPVIVTATEPTELVVTDGEPLLAPLVGDRLLYVTNTENDVLRDAHSGLVYVLLSGRWYSAKAASGPWTYVAADELPDVFREIPADSPKANLLASISGTDQADDAIADDQIPQTSNIARDDQTATVEWDGQPQFEPIAGTSLRYGVNTDAQILFVNDRYYLCDQGVWYVAADPNGPWTVSAVRPDGLDDLVPSCPVYNLRFVDIYSVSPDYVCDGYLPGYLGYYPCHGSVVYGTGYRYHPWRGHKHYYPRASTWGVHAQFNPWLDRWSFGFSYSAGFLRIGYRWQIGSGPPERRRPAPWFGPGGYHRPYLADDHHMLRTRPGRDKALALDMAPLNLYARGTNLQRSRKPVAAKPRPRDSGGAGHPVPLPNDVFAGSDGKVYQRGPDGSWKVNAGRRWLPAPVPVEPAPVVTPANPVGQGDPHLGRNGDHGRPQIEPVPAPVQQVVPSNPPGGKPVTMPSPPVREPMPMPRPGQPGSPGGSIVRTPGPGGSPAASPPGGGLERDFRSRERVLLKQPAFVRTPPPQQQPKPAPPERKKEEAPRPEGPKHDH